MSDLPPDSTVPPAPDAPLPADPALHPVHAELDKVEAGLSNTLSVSAEVLAWLKSEFAKIRALL
jgi:hypothetical protein